MNPPRPLPLYDRLGDEGIARLVDRLYYWMGVLPEARDVMALHPADLTDTKARLRAFLSTWLGGPDLYRPSYGEPFMRRRHFGIPIDSAARDNWMLCLRHALDDVVEDATVRAQLDAVFAAMANHLRNRADPGHDAAGSHACNCGGQACAA